MKTYISIDLKSFFASVECMERGLDPMKAKLVVADESRTNKTICLAVTPSLKAYGISGRPRLFEVEQKIKEIKIKTGEDIEYIVAKPQMKYYIEYSTKIYNVYLKYFSPEDIYVYSIDEVFVDITNYSKVHKMTAYELATEILIDILNTTGITATAGIGTNLYLSKVAMDIMAKKMHADKNGMRIASLDEMSYRKELWNHEPITDFWRVGKGYAKRLSENGLYTMGDVARCSLGRENEFYNEDLLYKIFGVNAELLIDHAWGYEPCTIKDIKSYKPRSKSINSGQVLHKPYEFENAKIIIKEMIESISLKLVDEERVTSQLTLRIDYEGIGNHKDIKYEGKVVNDSYGRKVPKHAQGTANIDRQTSSTKILTKELLLLYERIVDKNLLIRKVTITANNIINVEDIVQEESYEQLDLFSNNIEIDNVKKEEEIQLNKEKKLQEAMLGIRKKYGSNYILKGIDLLEEATGRDRNRQIGGHKE